MRVRIETPAGPTSLHYDLPESQAPGTTPLVVLAHGAGSDMHAPALARTAQAIAAAGFAACRFNFAYREAGRRLPDRMPALVACYAAVLDHVRSDPALAPPAIAIGGRSLGGRTAAHLAAAGAAVDALVLLSFPLHPAGRPGPARAAHLAAVSVPMLFVSGTRDALAEWALLEPLVRALPTATLHAIEGADHALALPKRVRPPEAVAREVDEAVVSWLGRLFDRARPPTDGPSAPGRNPRRAGRRRARPAWPSRWRPRDAASRGSRRPPPARP
ncbi:MAG TPA: alpha/beta family hydrolase [Candidatus Limnocylindria bacterium]|nr:alpha/beta family hydrolase [Candidatus Limnocylindria bacterium]